MNCFNLDSPEVLYYENFNLHDIVTPVDADELEILLCETKYDKQKSKYLIDGFRKGFEIGYRGKRDVKLEAPNLKLTVGSKIELWNKVMKEVKENRYAGPFKKIPFNNYIQSPIGLVPKDGGKATRLIFHLSYPRNSKTPKSVNANTPEHMATVKYPDFSDAIKLCMQYGEAAAVGKSDLKSAFRHLPIRIDDLCLLCMKCESPIDGLTYYFVDKCLPFGASISCSHFQAFSDALSHIVRMKADNREAVNYLDDFLFAALWHTICNGQIKLFLQLCARIRFPVSLEKNGMVNNKNRVPWSINRYSATEGVYSQ